jgi:putative acetyltransferase
MDGQAVPLIRVPNPDDYDAIYALIAAAFGRPDEADLVYRLRAEDQVVLELIAVDRGISGHILFSWLKAAPPTIRLASLAPLSVMPTRQNAGIGRMLMQEGLARCGAMGLDAVAVLGDVSYYRYFGFTRRAARGLICEYSGPAYQALEFREGVLAGGEWRVKYPKAFR